MLLSTEEAFDRRPELRALLEGLPRGQLARALAALCGEDYCLEDDSGTPLVCGTAWRGGDGGNRAPLEHELEIVGWLCLGPRSPVAAQALVPMLALLLLAAARYRMTAALHVAAIQEDYRVLLEKHGQLAQSEERLRKLSAELESRVQEQVAIIERAQRQLYQTEKMASVGQLAAGMAHEINNPIGFIRSNLVTAGGYVQRFAQLADAARRGDGAAVAAHWQRGDMDFVLEDFAQLLQESIDGADRVARIVADLKTFSSVDTTEDALVDLNQNLRSVVHMAQAQFGHVRIELDLQPLPRLSCHPGRLNQVFLSLVQNAAQAVADGGVVRVDSASSGDAVRVRVHDDGVGMAPEVLARAFDPFFTTRAVGQGTGLGLTVSRDIVMAHGGRIDIDSAPGRGTTVTVTLPLARGRGA
ncbi:MAG: ATP-binding protein [Pseudomonadota bacterium]|jgi:signal transduction histidine kinase